MDGHHDHTVSPPPGTHVVVVAGGEGPVQIDITDADRVIAADSGADRALSLGLQPDVVIGDMDSISPEASKQLEAAGATFIEASPDKDESDLDLALSLASEMSPRRISVVGGDRGRLSHLLTNAAVIASNRWGAIDVRWHTSDATVHVVRAGGTAELVGSSRDLVTLVPMHGTCRGVSTTGLRWPLADATVGAGSSLGLSNELIGETARIDLATGTLLVIHERQEP